MSDVRILVRSSVLTSLRRQRSLLVLMVVFVTSVLVCNGLVGAGVSRYAKSVQYRSALNLIEVSSVAVSARRQITDRTLHEAEAIPGVTGAYPFAQVDLALTDPQQWPDADTNPGSLFATPAIPGLTPAVVLGALPPSGLAADQIALPRSVPGGTLDRLLGRDVTMEFTKVLSAGQGEPSRRTFHVVAITDNTTPGEAGPTPSYVAPATLEQLQRASGGQGGDEIAYTTAYVRTASASDVSRVQRALADSGFAVQSVATQLRSLEGLFKVLSWAGWVFGGLLVLVCLTVGGLIGSSWVQQRTREIGLLKAVGWRRSRITRAVLLQLATVGLLASVTGVALGVLGSLVATAVVAGRHLDLLPVDAWRTPGAGLLLLTLLLVPACVALGGLRSAVRAVNVDADDALRDL